MHSEFVKRMISPDSVVSHSSVLKFPAPDMETGALDNNQGNVCQRNDFKLIP